VVEAVKVDIKIKLEATQRVVAVRAALGRSWKVQSLKHASLAESMFIA
jgi:hypothetical protein